MIFTAYNNYGISLLAKWYQDSILALLNSDDLECMIKTATRREKQTSCY